MEINQARLVFAREAPLAASGVVMLCLGNVKSGVLLDLK